MIVAVRHGNIAAHNLHNRLDFRELERISFLKILGIKKYWFQAVEGSAHGTN